MNLKISILTLLILASSALAQINENAVVCIETNNKLGTGVVISPDGIVLTAGHMLENAYGVKIRFTNNRETRPYTIYVDKNKDIAFCKVDPNDVISYLPLGVSKCLKPGDKIEMIGSSHSIAWWHSYGHISKPCFNGDLYMDIAGNPGNSGSPVLNSNDEIIGILTCGFKGYDGLVMGVEADYIKLALKVYEFFDIINAKSPFLDFVIWGQGWLLERPDILPVNKAQRGKAIVEK